MSSSYDAVENPFPPVDFGSQDRLSAGFGNVHPVLGVLHDVSVNDVHRHGLPLEVPLLFVSVHHRLMRWDEKI